MTAEAAMIFAAGLGTRMGMLTSNCPKPLLCVGGQTLLDHTLALVREAEIPRVVVNIHAHADQMRQHLAHAAPEVKISHEVERLETGGGLKHALPLLDAAPVFTLNIDMIWSGRNPLLTLRDAWEGNRMGALLLLVPRTGARGHLGAGDFFLSADGRITPRGASETADYVFTGAQILDPAPVHRVAEPAFSLWPVWEHLLAEGRMFGAVHSGEWTDVGTPEGLALAEAKSAP